MPYEPPTHSVERSLRATLGARTVVGVDEVGRGAWAGPVTVCAAVTGLRRPPEGLTDSKLITVKRRTELARVLVGWVTSYALGHASPEEIDRLATLFDTDADAQGVLHLTSPTPALDPKKGVRIVPGKKVQVGLTAKELAALKDRIHDLLAKIDAGKLKVQ